MYIDVNILISMYQRLLNLSIFVQVPHVTNHVPKVVGVKDHRTVKSFPRLSVRLNVIKAVVLALILANVVIYFVPVDVPGLNKAIVW